MEPTLAPWLNMGVSGAFMAIAWVIVTKSLPAAFDRIMAEFASKRQEFTAALEEERRARAEDREAFLHSLGDQRASNEKQIEHQLSVISAGQQRLEAKLEAALVHLTQQVSQLAAVVNSIIQDQRGKQNHG